MNDEKKITSVMVTGGSGFVGRYVVRELLKRGLTPVCLTRSASDVRRHHGPAAADRIVPVLGSLHDHGALEQAAEQSDAVIHLVGIIINRRLQGKTFRRIHVHGTENVLDAAVGCGIRRYVHMSALGTRPDAASEYHRTKWQAEQLVGQTGMNWTIFRPSLIHGYDGEFMQLIRSFVCGLLPPVIPYFGDGLGRLQPVDVRDVAYCMVESVFREDLSGDIIPMGGPNVYTWKELYRTCQRLIPGARPNKPLVGIPVGAAKALALVASPPLAVPEMIPPFQGLGKFRFDVGQVEMAQENAVCDARIAEEVFDIKLRSFEQELDAYGGRIR